MIFSVQNRTQLEEPAKSGSTLLKSKSCNSTAAGTFIARCFKGLGCIAMVSGRPYAAALIASLLIASLPSSPAPHTVRNLFEVLALAAMIRFMKPTVDQRLIPGLYALWLLFVFDTGRHAFAGATFFDQIMLVLEALTRMAVLGWSLTYGSLQQFIQGRSGAPASRLTVGCKIGPGYLMCRIPGGPPGLHAGRTTSGIGCHHRRCPGTDTLGLHQDIMRLDVFQPPRTPTATPADGAQPPGPPGAPHLPFFYLICDRRLVDPRARLRRPVPTGIITRQGNSCR